MSDLFELIDTFLKELNANFHVCLPGRILNYNADTQIASVQPLIKRLFYRETAAQIPPVINQVPIVFPRTATSFIRLPVSKDDIVLIIFTDRAIDNWVTGNGEPKDAISQRMHHINDAFAIPGGYPIGKQWKATNPNALEVQVKPGTKITIGNGNDELIALAYTAFQKLHDVASELSTTLANIELLTVTTSNGPSGTPINATDFATAKSNVDTLITDINTLVTNLSNLKV